MRADVSESIYLLLFVLRYKRDFFRCYSASIMETATTSNNAIFAKKKSDMKEIKRRPSPSAAVAAATAALVIIIAVGRYFIMVK